MRKIICLILSVLMLCTLCACGEPEAIVETVEVPVVETVEVPFIPPEYADIIASIESEDYDGAIALVNAMKPKPEVMEIQLTMDNLYDYFELLEYPEMSYRDADGSFMEAYKRTYLLLKEEYSLPGEEYSSDIVIDYTYEDGVMLFFADVDFENWTYDIVSKYEYQPERVSGQISELGEIMLYGNFDDADREQNGTARIGAGLTRFCLEAYGSGRPNGMPVSQLDLEIVNAEGTLYLTMNS